jgi:ADP-ribose pyrophosphatase YjhB (NUDIX family)
MASSFCPSCGNLLTIGNDMFAPQICGRCGRTQYHNSKPCAGGLVVKEDRLLLVVRAVEPFKDKWDIPGGFLLAGEHPMNGMLREVREETGLEVQAIELLGVYIDDYEHEGDQFYTLNHYYIVEHVDGLLRAADDVSAFRWFRIQELPDENQIAFRHVRAVLRDLQKRRPSNNSIYSSGVYDQTRTETDAKVTHPA